MTTIHPVDFHPIGDCEKKVRDFCLGPPGSPEKRDLSYEFYDLVWVPQDNQLHPFDIYLANNVGAGVVSDDFRKLWENRKRINQQLAKVPVNLDLADDRLEVFISWKDLEELFEACRVPGVAHAKISKILHKKRPRLIPLIDGAAIIEHRYNRPGCEDVAEDMIEITKLIRQDLYQNLGELNQIQKNVWRDHSIDLTLVRLIDIIFWQDYSEHRNV